MTWTINDLKGKQVYLDSNMFIYAVEGYPNFSALIDAIFKFLDAENFKAVASQLVFAEVLVKPLAMSDDVTVKIYEEILDERFCFNTLPITKEILLQSAAIRSTTKMKLPDAVHLATALNAKCDIFLTADKKIKSFQNLKLLLLSDLTLG